MRSSLDEKKGALETGKPSDLESIGDQSTQASPTKTKSQGQFEQVAESAHSYYSIVRDVHPFFKCFL